MIAMPDLDTLVPGGDDVTLAARCSWRNGIR